MTTIVDKLDKKIAINEGSLIGCLWKLPELYSEYKIAQDKLSEDGLFYYTLGEKIYMQGNEVFNEIAVYNTIEDNKGVKDYWDNKGGFQTIKELISTIDVRNIDAYFDSFNKWHYLKYLNSKGFSVELEFNKFEQMTSEQVYGYFEYILNSSNIDTVSNLEFEDLYITDAEMADIESGANMGLQYGVASPILNYLTMGIPKSELCSVNSFINEGKSSFTFSNMVIPIVENGHKVLICSNEQKSMSFKYLLQVYVLTKHFNYWGITRKKMKTGKFTEEDKEMMNKTREYIKDTYKDKLKFIKVYDYNMDVVTKAVKKYAKLGYEMVLYDVLKAEDATDSTWQQLIENSKELFKLASKHNLAILTTMQLQMALKGKVRRLGIESLANGKQAGEVQSEMLFFRSLYDDEIPKESKTYCNPYKLIKDVKTGKYTNVKECLVLDKEKQYAVFFLGKTRNDEVGKCILYEKNLNYNIWQEKGYCYIVDQNRY